MQHATSYQDKLKENLNIDSWLVVFRNGLRRNFFKPSEKHLRTIGTFLEESFLDIVEKAVKYAMWGGIIAFQLSTTRMQIDKRKTDKLAEIF